jgi:hypothetical protein
METAYSNSGGVAAEGEQEYCDVRGNDNVENMSQISLGVYTIFPSIDDEIIRITDLKTL